MKQKAIGVVKSIKGQVIEVEFAIGPDGQADFPQDGFQEGQGFGHVPGMDPDRDKGEE